MRDVILVIVCIIGLAFFWTLAFLLPKSVRVFFITIALVFTCVLIPIMRLSLSWLYKLKFWEKVEGTIEKVELKYEDGEPYTNAKIAFYTGDGTKHELEQFLSAFDEDEEDGKKDVNEMLENDKRMYENTSIPVLFPSGKPEEAIVLMVYFKPLDEK